MSCGKMTNGKVNIVHRRALRVLLNDNASSFEKLLRRKEEVTTHEKSSKAYSRDIRMYGLRVALLLWEFFNKNVLPYSLRINNILQLPNTKTKKYGNESLHSVEAYFEINFQINIKPQKLIMNVK